MTAQLVRDSEMHYSVRRIRYHMHLPSTQSDRVMKLGLTSVLLGLVIIITAPDWARAICVEVRPCEAYGLADAIFIGRLLGSRPAPDAGTEYVLRVLRDIRGVWTDTVVVHGGMTSVDVRFDASEP